MTCCQIADGQEETDSGQLSYYPDITSVDTINGRNPAPSGYVVGFFPLFTTIFDLRRCSPDFWTINSMFPILSKEQEAANQSRMEASSLLLDHHDTITKRQDHFGFHGNSRLSLSFQLEQPSNLSFFWVVYRGCETTQIYRLQKGLMNKPLLYQAPIMNHEPIRMPNSRIYSKQINDSCSYRDGCFQK